LIPRAIATPAPTIGNAIGKTEVIIDIQSDAIEVIEDVSVETIVDEESPSAASVGTAVAKHITAPVEATQAVDLAEVIKDLSLLIAFIS
jgi:hypothetical protein